MSPCHCEAQPRQSDWSKPDLLFYEKAPALRSAGAFHLTRRVAENGTVCFGYASQ
jgi:hypothetical protein